MVSVGVTDGLLVGERMVCLVESLADGQRTKMVCPVSWPQQPSAVFSEEKLAPRHRHLSTNNNDKKKHRRQLTREIRRLLIRETRTQYESPGEGEGKTTIHSVDFKTFIFNHDTDVRRLCPSRLFSVFYVVRHWA